MNRPSRSSSRLLAGTVGLLTALALTLTSCSSSGGDEQSKSGSSILDRVQSSGVLRVGTLTDNAPFESLDKNGELVGYDIDMINAIAKLMDAKPKFTTVSSAGRVTSLQSGQVDVVIANFTETPERSEVISFSDPIDLESNAIVVKSDAADVSSVEDMNDAKYTISTTAGGTSTQDLASQLPKAKPLVLPTLADVVRAVLTGKADAAAVANLQVPKFISDSGGKLKALSGALGAVANDCIGVPKGDKVWLDYVNSKVAEVNDNGTNYNLYQKWLKGIEPPPFAKQPVS